MTASNSNAAILNSAMNYLSHLLGLIECQDWEQFENVALSNPETFIMISRTISDCEEFNGMTLLHACVRFDPPISVLKKMITMYPRALMCEDCLGRTPLHVAAGSGSSPLIIRLLTVNYPAACNVQDEDGRTPLLFACDTSCELFEDDDSSTGPRDPPSLDTVRVLLAGSLDSVILEDVDEMNAVEYAIVSDAPIEVVNLLQRACQRVKRTNAKKTSDSRSASPTSSSSSFSASPISRIAVQC